jgi:hypothetical protein
MDSILNAETLKKHLLENLERLPESYIQEILDFAEFIRKKRYRGKTPKKKSKLTPKKDPILKLMGIADIEPFANKIDQELYGQ